MLKIVKNAFLGQYQVSWKWPSVASPDEWDPFEVKGPRGARLSALFGHSHSAPRGVLVFVHPLNKSAKGFWLTHGHAAFYRRTGFHVVLFDLNGFGESNSCSFNFAGDVIAVGQHMKKLYPRLAIGLLGASFGAGWSIYVMARKNHPFKAAILEGAFAHVPEHFQNTVSFRTLRVITRPIWPLVERNHFPVGYAKRIKHYPKVLLLHGEEDRLVTVQHSQRLADAMAKTADVEMYPIKNAGHNMIFVEQPEEYSKKVLPFLSAAFNQKC